MTRKNGRAFRQFVEVRRLRGSAVAAHHRPQVVDAQQKDVFLFRRSRTGKQKQPKRGVKHGF